MNNLPFIPKGGFSPLVWRAIPYILVNNLALDLVKNTATGYWISWARASGGLALISWHLTCSSPMHMHHPCSPPVVAGLVWFCCWCWWWICVPQVWIPPTSHFDVFLHFLFVALSAKYEYCKYMIYGRIGINGLQKVQHFHHNTFFQTGWWGMYYQWVVFFQDAAMPIILLKFCFSSIIPPLV